MLVEIIAKITADLPITPPDILNGDTLNDYKEELDCVLVNTAGDEVRYNGKWEEIEILSTVPCDIGIDDYNQILKNWELNYNQELQKWYEKLDKIKEG